MTAKTIEILLGIYKQGLEIYIDEMKRYSRGKLRSDDEKLNTLWDNMYTAYMAFCDYQLDLEATPEFRLALEEMLNDNT